MRRNRSLASSGQGTGVSIAGRKGTLDPTANQGTRGVIAHQLHIFLLSVYIGSFGVVPPQPLLEASGKAGCLQSTNPHLLAGH